MKMVKFFLKWTGILLLSIVLIITIIAVLFTNFSPQFGGTPSESQKKVYAESGHYKQGKFVNDIPTSMEMGFSKMKDLLYAYMFKASDHRQPAAPLPMETLDSAQVANHTDAVAQLTWFGHSACLLELEGKRIFFDPMLGQYAGPHRLLGPARYNKKLPLEVGQLPHLDAVVISHDHYDHLDYETILVLKEKTDRFYVPLGVSAHLLAWGVAPEAITELNWWDEVTTDGFTFVCTPARHFSGRGMTNRFSTLWCSWVVRTAHTSIYFSGDSGYGAHFKEIGDRYGPFNFVMMECGQYNELWDNIHMMPEETAQAALDVQTKLLMPIHWGAFTLALHSWTDPAERVTTRAKELGISITTPTIGEPVRFLNADVPSAHWWTTLSLK